VRLSRWPPGRLHPALDLESQQGGRPVERFRDSRLALQVDLPQRLYESTSCLASFAGASGTRVSTISNSFSKEGYST